MKYKLQNEENPAQELVEFLEEKGINSKESKYVARDIFCMFIQCGQDQLETAIKSLGGSDIDYQL